MKNITITFSVVVSMLLALTNVSFAGDTYVTGFGVISGNIEYNTSACKEEYPLLVTFSNRTVRTVGEISFALYAHYQDRSTNLIISNKTARIIDAYRGDGFSSGWNTDRIIDRFDEVGMCYSLPQLSDSNTHPEKLVWEIKIIDIKFK